MTSEPSQESLEKAKNMARDGKIREFGAEFTVYEYANLLDAKRDAAINVRIKDLENQLKILEQKETAKEAEKLLQDPRVKRFFKLD